MHHVGRAEPAGQLQPLLVVADHGDALGAEPAGGEHRAQPDRAVADDHDPVPELDAGRRWPRGARSAARRTAAAAARAGRPAARAAPRPGCRPRAGPAAPRPAPRRGPGSPKTPPSTQDVVSPDRQYSHVPSDQVKGEITRSPGRTVRTSAPTSVDDAEELVADPLAGLPLPVPPVRPEVGAAEPAADTTRTTASVGSSTSGSGTCWIRMLPGPSKTAARIPRDPSRAPGGYDSVASGLEPASAADVRALRRAAGPPRPSPRAARPARSSACSPTSRRTRPAPPSGTGRRRRRPACRAPAARAGAAGSSPARTAW